jgi:hypothetical protein
MTPAEAQTLLGIAASFDNRKPSEEAAIAWSHALGDLPFADCRDAIVTHYQASSDWLMPARVIVEVKHTRAKRLHDHPPLTPPPELADDPAAQIAWRADANRRIADGEVIDCDAAYGELKPRVLSDLRVLMPAPETTETEPEETSDE